MRRTSGTLLSIEDLAQSCAATRQIIKLAICILVEGSNEWKLKLQDGTLRSVLLGQVQGQTHLSRSGHNGFANNASPTPLGFTPGKNNMYILFPDHGAYSRYATSVRERLKLDWDHILQLGYFRIVDPSICAIAIETHLKYSKVLQHPIAWVLEVSMCFDRSIWVQRSTDMSHVDSCDMSHSWRSLLFCAQAVER